MKKFLAFVMALFLVAALAVGVWAYKKYSPSKELADPREWFGVSGNDIAVVLDNKLVKGVCGRLIDGQAYLPLAWVNDKLNERFYWSEEDSTIIYALPEDIDYVDSSMKGEDKSPLFVEQGGEVWLAPELILAYTDIRIEVHTGGEAKRVFIDTKWEPVTAAKTLRDGKIRVLGGIKSAILASVEAEESLEILDAMDEWSKVRTQSGYIGYIQNRILGETAKRELVSDFETPVYKSAEFGEPIRLVWHQVLSEPMNDNMEQLMADAKGINVIAPTWFMLTDNEGNYDSLADPAYVEKAHEMGLQVWAALDNFNRGEEVRSEVLFASTKARKKLIASLMAEVLEYGIDGINLDVEGIRSEAGVHYVQFIRELSVDCRKNGIILSVDSYVPSENTAFYNRAEQGRVADYVIIMGYDEHYSGGEAGSVASIGYERMGIERTLADVPAEKIIMAIPFYTRLWKVKEGETTSSAMGIAAAKKWVEENGVSLDWDEELGQYYGELEAEDGTYCLWMEEERSLGLKVDLIRQHELAGIACWKLGLADEKAWEALAGADVPE